MKWLVVVMFATMQNDIYIFTDPSFETREACYATLTKEEHIYKYTTKLFQEYGKPMPVLAVNCLQENTIEEILQNTQGQAI